MKKCYICQKPISGGLRSRCDGKGLYAHETCFYAASEVQLVPKGVPEYSSAPASGMSKTDKLQAIAKNIIGEVND